MAINQGGNVTSFTYDYESRVKSITYPNSTSDAYSYNAFDTRTAQTGVSGTKAFRRAGLGVTAPVLGDGSARFTPGVSERRDGTSTFLNSGIKNTDVQTAANESITATRQYDAWGNLLASSGTWKGPSGYGGAFGYQEDANGLHLLGYRYYDSTTGRFLTRDPIQDGRNWYSYCDNDPVNGADPTGLYNEDVYNIIIKGEGSKGQNGKFPKGTAQRYKNDPVFRKLVDTKIGEGKKQLKNTGRNKVPGRKDKKDGNPDLDEEGVTDAVNEALDKSPTQAPGRTRAGRSPGKPGNGPSRPRPSNPDDTLDKVVSGLLIVAGVVAVVALAGLIIGSGGTLAPVAAGAAAIIIIIFGGGGRPIIGQPVIGRGGGT